MHMIYSRGNNSIPTGTARQRPAQFRQRDAGFSLIELLVYIAVSTIIISAIVAFGFWIIRANAKTKLTREMIDSARSALETMSYEIKKSQSVYTPTAVFGANPGQLSLEQKIAAPGGETKAFVDFFQCGAALCLKKEGAAPVSLIGDKLKVSKLIFTQLANSATSTSIQINLKLESTASTTMAEYSDSIDLTATANLRVF